MNLWEEARGRGLPAAGFLMVVDVRTQRLHLLVRGQLLASYPVSTSRKGLGAQTDSGKTPPGWHRVAARIGSGHRRGSVFVSRRFTGEVFPRAEWRSGGKRDLILTRILRLRGLEPGVNCGRCVDSFSRYIYLHGTNQEQRLGRPASHGCIRLANDDILDLFNRLRGRAAWCWIGNVRAGILPSSASPAGSDPARSSVRASRKPAVRYARPS